MEVTNELRNPREEIKRLLLDGDLKTLLTKAGALHGHYCPGVALGIAAVHAGFNALGLMDNSGMEEVMAVVEGNSCVVDGIQYASGCTLGNNALVYCDYGKTAVTFYKRDTEKAVRLFVKDFSISRKDDPETMEADILFDKAVKKRQKLTNNERERMNELWIKRSFATVVKPALDLFNISMTIPPKIPFAPIVDSRICYKCGEKMMETHARMDNGKPICIPCAGVEYHAVIGKGISTGGINYSFVK